jgi:catechol 2,3-dioxygenase-like lactoylglutathione lyase family enzyme
MPAGAEDEARKFYGATLGLREIPSPSSLSHLNVVWFQSSDDGQEIHIYTDKGFEPSSPRQHFCVQVDDLAAIRKTIEGAGYTTKDVPVIPNRPRFNTADPFGNSIEIAEIVGDYN